ncbi:hypothetical protein VFMJ11_A0278 [Aliivibrio fischeri MJ11]|uniref:Uncharacterized protein n=1 Tax=Aliivibrio fischeri (strain MJ11) TaxID=388396 RepID=B5ET17_ALIFM|nr:hypothetical protein VFMJ11_A0278 [Aliivibrio fischeri MJ11]
MKYLFLIIVIILLEILSLMYHDLFILTLSIYSINQDLDHIYKLIIYVFENPYFNYPSKMVIMNITL